jgi:hypothetical protein
LRKRDRSDLEIHCTDARTPIAKNRELISRSFVVVEHRYAREEGKQRAQMAIGIDLLMACFWTERSVRATRASALQH